MIILMLQGVGLPSTESTIWLCHVTTVTKKGQKFLKPRFRFVNHGGIGSTS